MHVANAPPPDCIREMLSRMEVFGNRMEALRVRAPDIQTVSSKHAETRGTAAQCLFSQWLVLCAPDPDVVDGARA